MVTLMGGRLATRLSQAARTSARLNAARAADTFQKFFLVIPVFPLAGFEAWPTRGSMSLPGGRVNSPCPKIQASGESGFHQALDAFQAITLLYLVEIFISIVKRFAVKKQKGSNGWEALAERE